MEESLLSDVTSFQGALPISSIQEEVWNSRWTCVFFITNCKIHLLMLSQFIITTHGKLNKLRGMDFDHVDQDIVFRVSTISIIIASSIVTIRFQMGNVPVVRISKWNLVGLEVF